MLEQKNYIYVYSYAWLLCLNPVLWHVQNRKATHQRVQPQPQMFVFFVCCKISAVVNYCLLHTYDEEGGAIRISIHMPVTYDHIYIWHIYIIHFV